VFLKSLRLVAFVAAFLASVAHQPAAADIPVAQKTKIEGAWSAAGKAAKVGPAEITLLDQARISIRKGEAFIPATEANDIMEALGNGVNSDRVGIVVGTDTASNWMIDISWVKEGYVRDGDAQEWQADALLDNLKEGTEQGNTHRVARGFPALDVIGWIQPPAYDSSSHRLVWSLALRDRGAAASGPQTVNYNTYALGRDGYFSLDLITDNRTITADKAMVQNLLGSLQFVPGKRYEQFNVSTDKVAAYGLAALVGGVAVKKLGLLAVAGVFLLKLWKLIALGAIALAAAMRKFFKGRSPSE